MLSARPVRGLFRRLRWWANWILIAILFAVPWIRIGGEHLVLLDIPGRKFHVFGLVIFPQELFFLWLLVFGAALSLFFFTALFGRLWCGWACPQTVFTDLFAAMARRIQGWRGTRPPARIAPWRHGATHGVWILLSLVIGFHLVSYFHSPYDLLEQALVHDTIYPTVLGFHLVAAGLAYVDFAFLKQTFCKYLCPYARFQGVLFDRDSLVIGYDAQRGEPRGKRGRVGGDCVDCGLCVAVCPTGIDIRNGLQIECIACTQCIDACNGVMSRLGRDSNLIAYRSLVALERERPVRILRPRVLAYAAGLLAVGVSFVGLLSQRLPMDFQVAHNASALTSTLADGRVGNSFTLHIQNRDRDAHRFRVRLEQEQDYELLAGVNPIAVEGTSDAQMSVFVVAETQPVGEMPEIRFILEREGDEAGQIVKSTRFLTRGGSHGG